MSQDAAEVLSKETFLTSLQRSSSHGSHAAAASSPAAATAADATAATAAAASSAREEPHVMATVRERHAQLQQVISVVLGRQEKDFLAAYRAHMYTVQKELHELRDKLRRNETVENKSEKIKKLEDERDWYRKEALRLDAFTSSMSADLKAMRDKLEAIEGDRDWLEKQLKACKKQNKLLRAEVDARLAPCFAPSFAPSSDPSFDPVSSPPRASVASTPGARPTPTNADGLPVLNLEGVALSPSKAEEREDKLRKKLRQLKRELQHKTHELAVLGQQRGATTDAAGDGLSRLQSLFVQCVESVKDEVARRRSSPQATGDRGGKPSALAGSRQSRGTAPAESKPRNQRVDELGDFTSGDRVRLIERLLAHNEVLTLLYAQLFPPEDAAAAPSREPRAGGVLCSPGLREGASSCSWPTSPTLRSSESLPSARMGVEDAGRPDANHTPRALTPVGSGAAVASAARGAGLPLDSFTKDYLRSMRPQADS